MIDFSLERMECAIYRNTPKIKHEIFDAVIGVSRGGVIPGVFLSHILKIPFIPISYSSHYGCGSHEYTNTIPNIDRNLKYLIVDDIADSGATLLELKEIFPKSMSFVLVQKASADSFADFWGEFLMEDHWVKFFWETE